MNVSRMSKHDDKETALAQHLGVDVETIDNNYGDVYESSEEPGEYLVLSDSEADQAWEESLENYLDECVMPELPAVVQQYFDRDAWKRDAKLSDGRGHSLSSYDGEEHEVKVDGVWYYIYRVN
jgi:hypothetical protein